MTQKHLIPLGALLLLAAVSPLAAKKQYVTNPERGGTGNSAGAPLTTILATNTTSTSQTFQASFIATGADGTAARSKSNFTVGGGRRVAIKLSNVIRGVGMVELTSPDGVVIGAASYNLAVGSQNTNWSLPVIDATTNGFDPDAIAFIGNLSRLATAKSNVEIVNLASHAANCSIRRFDERDVEILPAIDVPVPPLSHKVTKDLFASTGQTDIDFAKAQASCDQPFYAYGTTIGVNGLGWKLRLPLAAPSAPVDESKTIAFDRNGLFLKAVNGHSQTSFTLPLLGGVAYRRMTIDYDVFVNHYSFIFTAFCGLFHQGGPRFNKTLYFGTFLRGMRSRSFLDQGIPTVEAAAKRDGPWHEGTNYHVAMTLDSEAQSLRWRVTENPSNRVIQDEEVGLYNTDIADRGAPLILDFGLPGVSDNAYFPPIGWRFSNLKVRATQ